MPAKKKAAAPAKADKVSDTEPEPAKEPVDARMVANREIAAETALRDAREAAVIEREKSAKPNAEGDIDERMAALLADHIEMGVRKG